MPVHVVATAVKNFFARLHEPIIPFSLQQKILQVLDDSDVSPLLILCKVIIQLPENLREIFSDLDKSNADVLRYFIGHLLGVGYILGLPYLLFIQVANSPATAMDIKNLSKVFFPTFFRPNFTDFAAMSSGTVQYQRAMEAIIVHSVHIFSSSV